MVGWDGKSLLKHDVPSIGWVDGGVGGDKPDVGLLESGWCGWLGWEKSTETRCTISRVGGWGGGWGVTNLM